MNLLSTVGDTAGAVFMQGGCCNPICGIYFGIKLHPLNCPLKPLLNANGTLQKNVNGIKETPLQLKGIISFVFIFFE